MINLFLNLFYGLISIIILFVFSLLFDGIDRKISAIMQNRKGPPILQSFYDFIKLSHKIRIIPKSASSLFVIMPYLSIVFVFLGGSLILNSLIMDFSFSGDLILIMYLLSMPSIMIGLGGFSSGNPYGMIGASRLLLMFVTYKIPLIISVFLIVFKMGTFSLQDIIIFQLVTRKPLILQFPSMVFVFIMYILCIPSAVGVVPFDIAEAKTEIIYGSLIEYSGLYLAFFKLTKMVLSFVLIFLASLLFLSVIVPSNPSPWVTLIIALLFTFILTVCVITIPRNLFARMKINHAIHFYRRIMLFFLCISIVLIIIE